jgi:hypothetical protein
MPVNHFLPAVGNTTVGLRTPHGTWLPPGSRVAAYVGPQSESTDAYASSSLLVSTLNEGLARCRSGKGDVVALLPGYTENVSTADYASSLVAGTRIIGVGAPGESIHPTLTWTAAAATFLLDVANVTIDNVTLNFSGVADCAAPMTVSAAGCGVQNCRIIMQNDTSSFSAIKGLALASGANQFRLVGNVFETDSEDDDANVTGGCLNVGAAVSGVRVRHNHFTFACPGDTVGIIDVTAAAKLLDIRDNYFYQLATDAAFAIIVDNVAARGTVARNYIRITENVAPTSAGVSAGASAFLLLHDNQVSAAQAATTATHAADA